MSGQLPLGSWAPPDADAQPVREPKEPPRERRQRMQDEERQDARARRPLTPQERAEQNRRDHEALLARIYGRFSVTPPRLDDPADRKRADDQVAAVLAERKAHADAVGGGTWIYGTFMTWEDFAVEFERREGRKPGEPLTAAQRRELRWGAR